MPRTICSDEVFWATKLEVLEWVHPAPMLSMKPFHVCFVVCANRRKCSRCLLLRVSDATTPRAKLHSGGPSTSPCSARRTFGIGWTPSCSAKERERDFTTWQLLRVWRKGWLLSSPHSIRSFRAKGAFTDPVAHSSKMSWWKMARA